MTSLLIDIIPILLLLLIFCKARVIPSCSENFNCEYLSLDTGKSLRGIFSVFVVLRHITVHTTAGVLFPLNKHMGFLSVAVFFFLSGYGLMKQQRSRENYRDCFLRKRLCPILVSYAFINVAYWLMFSAMELRLSWIEIIALFAYGKPMAQHSWYIISIIFFYLTFWVLMKLFKNRGGCIILGSVGYCVANYFFCKSVNWAIQWYSTNHLLVFGMLWAMYEEKILATIQKKYILTLTMSAVLCVVLFVVKTMLPKESFVLRAILGPTFVLSVLLVGLKIKTGNTILAFLGDISLETYLCHGMFILIFRKLVYIPNDFLYVLCVLAASILFAYLFHKCNLALARRAKRRLR